jgi:hypothetical protein
VKRQDLSGGDCREASFLDLGDGFLVETRRPSAGGVIWQDLYLDGLGRIYWIDTPSVDPADPTIGPGRGTRARGVAVRPGAPQELPEAS